MTIGRHFEMTTMVILVVILWSLIIWRPWSSFQNHDHQRGHGHLFGRIPFGQVCFFGLFLKFQTRQPSPADKHLANWDSSHCWWQWRTKNELARCVAISSWFGLVTFFAYHHHPRWYWGCFNIRLWRYVHINARCVCGNLLVVSDKSEQLIWVNKQAFGSLPPLPVINMAHGIV